VVDPKTKEHRGRIVKTMGDGFLAEFANVVDAVCLSMMFEAIGFLDRLNAATRAGFGWARRGGGK
jgi:class 3 adenylate cyclase